MSKDFEQQAKQKGEQFSLPPREQVWLRIEDALKEKKRRGVAWWWWGLPLLLLLGSGLAYYLYSDTNEAPVVAANTIERTETKDQPTSSSLDKTDQATQTPPISHTAKPGDEPTATSEDGNQKQPFRGLDQRTSTTSSNTRTPSNPNGNGTTAESKGPDSRAIVDEPAKANPHTMPSEAPVTPQAIAGTGVAIESSTASDSQTPTESSTAIIAPVVVAGAVAEPAEPGQTIASSDSTAAAPPTIEMVDSNAQTATANKSGIKPISGKKVQWFVQAGIGKSTMGEFDIIPGGEKAMADPLMSNVGGGMSNSSGTFKSDEAGVTFNLAMQRRQALGKRWQWHAGLGWQYQQISQYHGTKVDSAIFLDASLSLSNAYFYQSGSTSSEKGINHRIVLSNDFSWQVLKNQSWLRLNAGIYTGFNISNDYYVRDYAQRMVKNDGLYSDWFMGFTPGIEFVFKNKWTLGASTYFDFTKAYKELNGTPQYWRGWEIKAGISLFNK